MTVKISTPPRRIRRRKPAETMDLPMTPRKLTEEIPARDPEVIPGTSLKEIRIPETADPAALMTPEPAAAKTAQMMQRTFQKGKLLMRAMTHHPARQTAHQILQTQLTQKRTQTPQQLLLRR